VRDLRIYHYIFEFLFLYQKRKTGIPGFLRIEEEKRNMFFGVWETHSGRGVAERMLCLGRLQANMVGK